MFALAFGAHRLGTTLARTLRPRGPNALVLAAAVGTLAFAAVVVAASSALGLRLGPLAFFIDAAYWAPLLRAAFVREGRR